ncbi:MAG: diguanylate cyclase [Geminicoccaceae bacterium]|nr:diguanylate cyclase [Geminicoccaceae bacterium]
MKPISWHANRRLSGCAFPWQLPEMEWQMRGGFAVEIVEARPGSLATLAEWLDGNGYGLTRLTPATLAGRAASPAPRVRLIEVAADQDATRLALLCRRQPDEGVAVAALTDESEALSLSKALAIGVDDLLTYPFDEEELRIRLDALHQLGRARAALRERALTFARFQPPKAVSAPAAARSRRRPGGGDRPRVLVIGPASQHKVKIGEALGQAALNFADNLEKAKGPILTRSFDMIVLLGTNAAARRDLLRWTDLATDHPPVTILVLDQSSDGEPLDARRRLAHLPVADRLMLPQPAELVRARMDFWLGFAALQRRLLAPPEDELRGLCHEPLTGLFNHGFFLEHLRTIERGAVQRGGLVLVELINLPRLNEAAGHAAVNRYLAALGPMLRRDLRAEDLAAHLGAGRFAVLLDDIGSGAATLIGRRLERLLTRVPHDLPITPRLTARSVQLDDAMPPLRALHEAMRWRPQAPAAAA